MEKNPRDMTISEAMKHYGLPDHWEASEVAAWVMARTSKPSGPQADDDPAMGGWLIGG